MQHLTPLVVAQGMSEIEVLEVDRAVSQLPNRNDDCLQHADLYTSQHLLYGKECVFVSLHKLSLIPTSDLFEECEY